MKTKSLNTLPDDISSADIDMQDVNVPNPDKTVGANISKPDDFSMFIEKNIPSPEEFGLIFDKEKEISLPEQSQNELPKDNSDKKKSFFSRIFQKREKAKTPPEMPLIPEKTNELPDFITGIDTKNDMSQTGVIAQPFDFPMINADTNIKGGSSKKEVSKKEGKVSSGSMPDLPDKFKLTKLTSESKDLIKKISELKSLQSTLNKDKNKIDSLKQSLYVQSGSLDERERQLKEKLNKVKELKSALNSKSGELVEKIKEIKDTDLKLNEKKNLLEKRESKLLETKNAFLEKENSLNTLKKDLDEKTREVKAIETKYRQRLVDIEKSFEELNKLKEAVYNKEYSLAEKIDLNKQEKTLLKELREKYLKSEIAKAKELTANLKHKTKDILDKVADSRNIHEKVSLKKKILEDKEEKLRQKDKVLKEKDSALRLRASLKHHVEEKNEELAKKEVILKNKEDELKRFSEMLKNKEKELSEAKNELDKSMIRYSKEKEDSEDEEFREYLHKKLSEITKTDKSEKEPSFSVPQPRTQDKWQKINYAIGECKKQISQRNFEGAKKLYNQLRLDYNETDIPLEDKKALYNQIRSIYDDINLGMLSR